MNEAKALTLEAGKFYRTRDGRKAEVIGKTALNKYYMYVGVIEGRNEAFSFMENGSNDPLKKSPHDLIAEWVEPKRIKGWLAMCRHGRYFSDVKPSKEEATQSFKSYFGSTSIFACIEIDVLEGHGLNREVA